MESTNQAPPVSNARWLKIAVPATLVAGLAAGALFSPAGIAAAEEDGLAAEQTSGEGAAAKTDEERLAHRAEHKAGREEHKAGREEHKADREEHKADREEHKADRLANLAEVTGISEADLEAGFEEGQTLAEIAEANDVDREALIAALSSNAEERIDSAVAEGKFDAEKAAEIKENLEERIGDRIDHVPGERAEGAEGRGRRGKGHSRPGGGSADSDSADSDSGAVTTGASISI